MKTLIISMGVGLLACFTLSAQMVINQNNYVRKASFTDSVASTSQTGIAVPSHGNNQFWDYSTLVAQNWGSNVYLDASASPNFPNALNYFNSDLFFQGYTIPNDIYEAIDVNGWYEMGRATPRTPYSITNVTGGPNDSLVFNADNEIYAGRLDMIKFPMAYQDTWNQTHIDEFQFELTVAAFSLSQTPGYRKRRLSHTRTVVGEGKLVIPRADGSPSDSLDVLLLKVARTSVDSFFVAGSQAPAPLMTAFGLTQGTTATDSFYVFYREDFGAPVLNINLTSTGQVSTAFYRTEATSVSLKEVAFNQANLFPNPVAQGQVLNLELTSNSGPITHLSFMDLQGREILRTKIQIINGHVDFQIPNTLTPGVYWVNAIGQKQNLMGVGKLQVQ